MRLSDFYIYGQAFVSKFIHMDKKHTHSVQIFS